MSQPDEDGFNVAPLPEPELLVLAPLSRAALLRAERSVWSWTGSKRTAGGRLYSAYASRQA